MTENNDISTNLLTTQATLLAEGFIYETEASFRLTEKGELAALDKWAKIPEPDKTLMALLLLT